MLTPGQSIELRLHEPLDVAGGAAIELNDSIQLDQHPRVARFRVHRDKRWVEAETRPGDLVAAGPFVFRLEKITSRDAPATLSVLAGPEPVTDGSIGSPFRLFVGQRARLDDRRAIELIAKTRYGVVLFYTDSDGLRNYSTCHLGFWRDDDLLFRFEEAGDDSLSVLAQDESSANRRVTARYGERFRLEPADVAELPDGLTLRLRSAERYNYGVVGWRFFANMGEDVSYPYVSLAAPGSPARDDDFNLLNRRHTLRLTSESIEDPPAVELMLEAQPRAGFPLDAVFSLPVMESHEGPGGIAVRYLGEGHGHGETMGPNGELIAVTDAWASFEVTLGHQSSGFSVDLMAFSGHDAHHLFGYTFIVRDVGESAASIEISRTAGPELEEDPDEDILCDVDVEE